MVNHSERHTHTKVQLVEFSGYGFHRCLCIESIQRAAVESGQKTCIGVTVLVWEAQLGLIGTADLSQVIILSEAKFCYMRNRDN